MPSILKYKNHKKINGVELPNSWELSKVKYLGDYLNGFAFKPTHWTDEGLPIIRIQNLTNQDADINRTSLVAPERYRVFKGDILISWSATLDVYIWQKETAWLNQHIYNVKVNREKIIEKYFYWTAKWFMGELNESSHGSTMQHLTTDKFGSFSVPLPPISEQHSITDFLDYETSQIDTLIKKQQTLIQLLREKRQAVISHAVTKGLNPDAPMKDSGIEWLGEVPEHWNVMPAKRFFKLVAEPAPSNNDYELLSVYTAIGVRPRKDLEQKGNKASTTDGYWKVEKGDIVVNKLLAWMGAVGYSDYEGVTSPAYDILRATKDINSKFYHYLFRTKLANMEFKRWSRGIMEMRLRLYFDELGRIFMPLPSKKEQDLIVEKIEKMDNQFDNLIKKSEYNIQLMQERRTALISAAVTGKIDVRGWQAPDNEAVF